MSVVEGETTTLTVANQPGGAVTVTKLDEQGDLLPGACFQLRTAFEDGVGEVVADACDSVDGRLDGVTRLVGQQLGLDGTYQIEESVAPPGYTAGPSERVALRRAGPRIADGDQSGYRRDRCAAHLEGGRSGRAAAVRLL